VTVEVKQFYFVVVDDIVVVVVFAVIVVVQSYPLLRLSTLNWTRRAKFFHRVETIRRLFLCGSLTESETFNIFADIAFDTEIPNGAAQRKVLLRQEYARKVIQVKKVS
jgi:hypothetical protein